MVLTQRLGFFKRTLGPAQPRTPQPPRPYDFTNDTLARARFSDSRELSGHATAPNAHLAKPEEEGRERRREVVFFCFFLFFVFYRWRPGRVKPGLVEWSTNQLLKEGEN